MRLGSLIDKRDTTRMEHYKKAIKEPKKKESKFGIPTETYSYRKSYEGQKSHVEYFTQRDKDKNFRMLGVKNGMADETVKTPATRIPYNLDRLENERPKIIFWCEGEKDCNAMNEALKDYPHCIATTSQNGALGFKQTWKWKMFMLKHFYSISLISVRML